MKVIKNVFLDTNFNGKLATDGFIHIDLAPAVHVRESKLEATEIEIKTRDDSHPPVLVVVDDLARLPFSKILQLPSCLTWCSHAMKSQDLAAFLQAKYQGITDDTEFAIYFYKKVKATA